MPELRATFEMENLVMKTLAVLFGTMGLMALLSGCEAPGVYGGAYGGVYGEYPTTYYGGYYSYPAYPYYYGHYHYRHGPYDRDHYSDRDRHWNRHAYHYGHHD